jgi:DNA-binding response OmpR family regulator
MTPMRVLLVEDDLRFATALTAALRRAGYDVHHALSVRAALSAPPRDLVLLDLNLPDGDGVEVCRRLRRDGDVGIIMLTARGEERDRVVGLRSGADDYVVKPFSFVELQARMESVLRRARPRQGGVHVVGDLCVDLDRHLVRVGDELVELTRKQFQLLAILVAVPGVAVRREFLLTEVWHSSWTGRSRTLDVHMATLRARIGGGARIQTIRGVGYRLVSGPDAAEA